VILGRSELIPASDGRWTEMFSRLRHDVYHTREYHISSGVEPADNPLLFAYSEGPRNFLWPYVLMPLDLLPGFEGCGFSDASSVYGYAGPVASPEPDFVERGWRALLDHWRMQDVVSAFTRLHPLLANGCLFENVRDAQGEPAAAGLRPRGWTVSMDLTIDPREQVRQYSKVLRQEIRKSRELGFQTHLDTNWDHADDFVRLLNDTIRRRNGKAKYLIENAWVARFKEMMGSHALLFVTTFAGTVAAALLALEYDGFLHAHLTGINADLLAHSPLKALLDDVRTFGVARGYRLFHLGGGLGGADDSLFRFKRRFSPTIHEFQIGCWILQPRAYSELESLSRQFFANQGIDLGHPDFFPIYRYRPDSGGVAR
jgi:hypothetical protein